MKECYVWMDYCCMNQDSKNLSEELEQYDRIVEVCDCLFTPIVNIDETLWRKFRGIDVFESYKAKRWNQGPDAYLNRAWCRVEMLYAAMIPVRENDSSETKRHTMFEAGLALVSQRSRPHFLYDMVRLLASKTPYCLPPLQHSNLDDYHPLKGHLTNLSDIYHIRQLLSDLQPYIKSRSITVGYSGKSNEDGQPHGKGKMFYADGSSYDGEWKNGMKHGYGVGTNANGNRYVGYWKKDRKNGRGTYYHFDGAVYRGLWKNSMRCGHGVYTFPNGVVYKGEFLYNVKHGYGRYRYADGSVYTGEWKQDKRCGHGMFTSACGIACEGEWSNGDFLR